jgi:hypothetical protein
MTGGAKLKVVTEIAFNTPLYKRIEYGKSEHSPLSSYYWNGIKVRYYCPYCNDVSIFSFVEADSVGYWIGQTKVYSKLVLKCSIHGAHVVCLFFSDIKPVEDRFCVVKIGQEPSLAEFQIPQIHKYKKLLRKYYGEFSRAIGLSTHGVGIGSFVYMRRIIESLLEDAHIVAQADANWKEDVYIKGRVADRIDLLKNYLPAILVENKESYSILSKGMHELDEDECLGYFPVLKDFIEIMLDEKLNEMERGKKMQDMKKALQVMTQQIKTK